jgi:hypothetical protein
MSTAQILDTQMLPVGRGVRAFFAPVDRVNVVPTIFDPSTAACSFDLDAPPQPWIDLGSVDHFQRAAQSAVNVVRTGESGAVSAQFRSALDARVECEFLSWGKLQMALAGGSMHYNVLAPAGSSAAPCGGRAVLAAMLLSGSSSSQIALSTTDLVKFSAGDLVVVDVDYHGETGHLGTGIQSAFVAANDGVARDFDFTRRVSFNVGRVQQVTSTALVLDQPLPGGAPAINAGVQKVVGFVDREGGSYFQEWSAVFALPEDSGGRIFFYYPRLQVMSGPSENTKLIADPIVGRTLKASFRALPIVDLMDGEQAVCYRSYLAAPTAPAY